MGSCDKVGGGGGVAETGKGEDTGLRWLISVGERADRGLRRSVNGWKQMGVLNNGRVYFVRRTL